MNKVIKWYIFLLSFYIFFILTSLYLCFNMASERKENIALKNIGYVQSNIRNNIITSKKEIEENKKIGKEAKKIEEEKKANIKEKEEADKIEKEEATKIAKEEEEAASQFQIQKEKVIAAQKEESEPQITLNNGWVSTEGNVPQYLINKLNDRLGLIPSKLMDMFTSKGYKIILTSYSIGLKHCHPAENISIAGLFEPNEKIIYISARESAINGATLHEFGHFIDVELLGFNSQKSDFVNIFNLEKDSFQVDSADGWYKTTSAEYFAEVFQETILNPSRCQSSAPRSYEFVMSKISCI